MGVLTTFLFLKEPYWLAHHRFFGTLGIPQLENLFAPMHVPLWPTFFVYIHESWTLGKPYGINLRCYSKHLGEHFVNLMVTPWDQGIFFLNPSLHFPPSPQKERFFLKIILQNWCNFCNKYTSYIENTSFGKIHPWQIH